MRELTKSAMSTGLAMSAFGAQQMVNALRRPQPGQPHPLTDSFNRVAQTMADQCGETLRESYHAGDKIQRELVDVTYRLLMLEPFTQSGGGSLSNMLKQTTEQFGQMMGSPGRCCGGQSESDASDETGWGPVPPAA